MNAQLRRTFDHRPRFDPRSLQFRAAAGVTQMPTAGAVWGVGPVLDQGQEGACVGFGCTGAVAADPAGRRSSATPRYARAWYRRAQRFDQWPGEAYEGTSVLAGCLVGRQRKLWTGFRWAKHPAELAAGILASELGPAIIGVQWSTQLYETGKHGQLPADVTLDPAMGHCVLVFGYLPAPADVSKPLRDRVRSLGVWPAVDQQPEPSFLVLNSWGPSWGVNGVGVVPLGLMRRWFAAQGEFALPENRTKGARMTSTEQNTEAVEPEDDGEEQERAGDSTLHLTAEELQDGDRLLDPPEELGQESVTVRGSVQLVNGYMGRTVMVNSTAGTFPLGAGTAVTVRRTAS